MAEAQFGSVEWQDSMLHRVQRKILNNEKLDPMESTFLLIQSEKMLREGKITRKDYDKLKKLIL